MSTDHGYVTLTELEHAVIAALTEHGPCDTGPTTRSFERRRLRFADHLASVQLVHQVDLKVCRRLQKAGLVRIDPGGVAHLVDAGCREEAARG